MPATVQMTAPAHDDGAIDPVEAGPWPMTDNSDGAGHELEQGIKPVVPTTARSHPVVEGDPESGDTVGSRAKMEPTFQRVEKASGSPGEGGARVQKDSGTVLGGALMPSGACRGSRRLEAEGGARLV